MITSIYEFYKLITEKAFNIDDADDCIMLRETSKNEVKICLYNYVDKSILGYISADNASKDDFYTVDRVSAERGWGPFMYTLILQTLYPTGVKPSYIIKPAAHSVWKQFVDNPNIDVKELPQTDKNYTSKWIPAKGFSNDGYAEDDVDTINTIFYMPHREWFQPLVNNSEKIIAEHNINTKAVFKQCLDYFYTKYYMTSEAASIPNKDTTDKYLMVLEKGSSIQLMIQDKSNIFGYAEVLKKPDHFRIVNIAAEPGYGPFLYDTLMLWLDKPVRPSHSLTMEAWRVWNTYLNDRPDVTKKPVKKEIWTDIDLDQKMNTNSAYVEPINYMYTITDEQRKTATVDWWYESEQQFVNQMKQKLPGWMEIRFNQCKMWFNNKYPMHR